MATQARLLADCDKLRATEQAAKTHHANAQRNYRAGLLACYDSDVSVKSLAERYRTSWAWMSGLLDRARAERAGIRGEAGD